MKRWSSLYLASIVLLALALRLPRFLTAQVVLTEGTTYATIARNLAAGRGYVGILGVRDFFVPPLYPLLISGLIRLGLDALWAGRLLSLILGALLPLPVYWLTRELSGRRAAGLFAALFIAFHPLLIVYAGRVWSETAYSFLVWCGLCFTWTALRRGRWIAAALAGFCFGAAYLTRHEGAVYFGVFMGLLIAVWAWKRMQRRKGAKAQGRKGAGSKGARSQRCKVARGQGSKGAREQGSRGAEAQGGREGKVVSLPATLRPCDPAVILKQIAVALVAFALLAAPYVLWLSDQAGRFMWETKSVPNFVTAQRMAAGMSYMEAAYGLTSAGEPAGPFLFRNELLRNPPEDGELSLAVRLRGALNGLRDEARLLGTEIASPLALLLALLGLLSGLWAEVPWRRRMLAGTGFLLAFLLPSLAAISLVPRVYTRYLTPVTGYVALWSGMALAAGYHWIREAWGKRKRLASMAALTLTLLTLAAAVHTIQGGLLAFRPPRAVVDLDQRRAGEWLAAYDPSPEKRIMSVHSQLPFYAGGVHVPMPYAEPELVQRYAETRDVDYVVVSPRKLRSRPPLLPWTRGEAMPEGWRPVYRDADTGLTIYRMAISAP